MVAMVSTHFRAPHRPSDRDLHTLRLYADLAGEPISNMMGIPQRDDPVELIGRAVLARLLHGGRSSHQEMEGLNALSHNREAGWSDFGSGVRLWRGVVCRVRRWLFSSVGSGTPVGRRVGTLTSPVLLRPSRCRVAGDRAPSETTGRGRKPPNGAPPVDRTLGPTLLAGP